MTHPNDPYLIAWWAENLGGIDREIARLALICHVPILDPGVIERVLHKDASVCGTNNPIAFAKLHDVVMLHFAVREKSAGSVGNVQTAMVEAEIIDRLRKSFPDVGELPSGLRDALSRTARPSGKA